MKKLTKSQKQMIMLGGVLGAIVIVLALFVFKPPEAQPLTPYVPEAVETAISKDLLTQPEFRLLSAPVPPRPLGAIGRKNPFDPYQ